MNLTRPERFVFLFVCLVGLGWAAYTAHVWEDYYITYRAAKNLATGHGLVFTPGEKVHSFTSPLGVLLPALGSLATLNTSDAGALWLFRCVSIGALGGAAVFLWRLACLSPRGWIAGGLMVGLLATDNKIADYTINGMETGILLLFLAWTLWATLTTPPRQFWHLGLAWAGLMWTRPDACISIAAIAVGALLFRPRVCGDRGTLLATYAKAAGVTTALYLPWVLWTTWYYGSPVPHTIKAKGLFHEQTLAALGRGLMKYPGKLWRGETSLAATFMPPYGLEMGWPPIVAKVSLGVSIFLLVVWIVPWVRWEARVASGAFLAGHLYLTTVVGYPFPWYIPAITLLGIVALALVLGQAIAACRRGAKSKTKTILGGGLAALAIALILASATLSGFTAFNLRTQQRIVENGNRRELGVWLRTQAHADTETVFLEPLGYIGYFSGLKMLDFPGLCSREVVAARLRAKSHDSPACWPEIIHDLRPDWLVLRPFEVRVIAESDPALLQVGYRRDKVFDVTPAVAAMRFLPGRAYLEYDAVFEVYRRIGASPAP